MKLFPRRSVRRGAVPSSLIGLVAFSFTLLAFGTVAYTVSLPSLVAAAGHSDGDSLFHVISAQLLGAGAGDPAGSGDPASDDGEHAGDADGASGQPGELPPRGSITLGGSSLQGILDQIGGSGSGQGGDAGSGPGDGGSDAGSGNGGSDSGSGGSGSDGGSDSGQTPGEPAPTPEEERKAYEFLAAKAQLIDTYIARVNACTEAFNNDCLASQEVRRAHSAECESLWTALFYEFDQVVNRSNVQNGSQYHKAHGDLISMYRLLRDYVSVLCEAWQINVGFSDPASSVDAFMEPIRRNEVDGVNVQLAEFREVYEGFVL